MSRSLTDNTTLCYRSCMNFTDSKSPAFLIDGNLSLKNRFFRKFPSDIFRLRLDIRKIQLLERISMATTQHKNVPEAFEGTREHDHRRGVRDDGPFIRLSLFNQIAISYFVSYTHRSNVR